MLQAPFNNLIITVATKYIKNISDILRVAAIENNSSVDSVDIVNIVGTVISIPKSITTEKRGYEGFATKDILIGDTAIFRFDVIHAFNDTTKGDRSFKNLIWYSGKEYWLCDIQKVFGIIRDGEIKMINGYVMLTDFEPKKIVLPAHMRNVRGTQQSEIMHIGSSKVNEKPINAIQGDNVFFNPILAAKYQIKGKPFRIIQQEKILGKVA